jgi:hypothetical protein
MIVYALKQEAMYRDITMCAREVESTLKIARGKRQPRVLIVDPLVQQSGMEDREDDNDDDTGLREEDNSNIDAERGLWRVMRSW